MSADYYKLLGVEKNCSDNDIKKAYRKLAMIWHPDKHINDADSDKKKAEEKFKQINKAYEILGNTEKRKQYDQFGENAFSGSSGYQFNAPNDIFNTFFKSFGNGFDISELCGLGGRNGVFINGRTGHKIHVENMFNRHNNAFHNANGPRAHMQREFFNNDSDDDFEEAKKDDTVFVDLNVSLEELYHGVTKKMKISRKVHAGNRTKSETEILTVDVKPGWKEGTKITFNNKGDVNPGTEPADMVFVIKQKPHDVWTRDGADLVIHLDTTSNEIVNGFERTIMDICGEKVVIKMKKNQIPDSSYVHVVKDHGMPIRKEGKIIGRGNMIVMFNVKFK